MSKILPPEEKNVTLSVKILHSQKILLVQKLSESRLIGNKYKLTKRKAFGRKYTKFSHNLMKIAWQIFPTETNIVLTSNYFFSVGKNCAYHFQRASMIINNMSALLK